MPSIMTTVEPIIGAVLIQINWTDIPTVTHAQVLRVTADGTQTPVRAHTSVADSWYIALSGGIAVLYDTEAPLDQTIYYITEGLGSTATGTSTPPVVLPSGNNFWLKAPLRPWADQRVVLSIPQEPDCIPMGALFFQSMGDEARQSRSTQFVVNNRSLPIATTRRRGGIASTLIVISRKFTDRDNVIALNADGDPLLWEGPAAYGEPDQYMTIGEYVVGRLSADHRVQWRTHTLPYIEISRPAGLADGILGNRWADICDVYPTFGDATTAGLTWTEVLLGLAALTPTPGLTYRTYADIPVDFATYADIPVGGRTYTDLFEDR